MIMKYIGTPYNGKELAELVSKFNSSSSNLMSVIPLMSVAEVNPDFALKVKDDGNLYFFDFGNHIAWHKSSRPQLASITDEQRCFVQVYENFKGKVGLCKMDVMFGIRLGELFFPITPRRKGDGYKILKSLTPSPTNVLSINLPLCGLSNLETRDGTLYFEFGSLL